MAKKVNEETLVDVEVKEVKPKRKVTVKQNTKEKKAEVEAITQEVENELNGESETPNVPKTRLSDDGEIDLTAISSQKKHITTRLQRFLMKKT